MIKVSSLLFAAILFTSASAFAADTPDPNATGPAALPSGSNANTPPTDNSANASAGKNDSNANAVATTPGEENKGKPKVAPQ